VTPSRITVVIRRTSAGCCGACWRRRRELPGRRPGSDRAVDGSTDGRTPPRWSVPTVPGSEPGAGACNAGIRAASGIQILLDDDWRPRRSDGASRARPPRRYGGGGRRSHCRHGRFPSIRALCRQRPAPVWSGCAPGLPSRQGRLHRQLSVRREVLHRSAVRRGLRVHGMRLRAALRLRRRRSCPRAGRHRPPAYADKTRAASPAIAPRAYRVLFAAKHPSVVEHQAVRICPGPVEVARPCGRSCPGGYVTERVPRCVVAAGVERRKSRRASTGTGTHRHFMVRVLGERDRSKTPIAPAALGPRTRRRR
jgi:hypothetical protein